jgi:RNA polymerase sigma-70 factor (ECF subfamily)
LERTQDAEPKTTVADCQLIEALLGHEEWAFVELVECHHESLLRLARVYVPTGHLAEEAVQETWVAVVNGIARFEGRSSLKTWIFRILMNRARSLGRHEGRYVSFATAFDPAHDHGEPAVDPDRFIREEGAALEGHWNQPPTSWGADPETELLNQEVLNVIEDVITGLPPNQKEVITLRDIEGWSAREVCNILEISETNQRVLLHRARSRVRAALEQYMSPSENRGRR